MISRISFSALLLTIAIIMGCSSSGNQPVYPGSTPGMFDESIAGQAENHCLIFDGTMIIDPVGKSIDIIERSEAANYNITGFLASACSGGCFRYTILSYANEILTIKLEIENPTSLQAYDLRMIFTNLYGKKVLNPDNFTGLFDSPGGMPFNPQIAFRKELESRAFPIGPGTKDDETLMLRFPPGSNPAVDFVIAGSYPGQCAEPYQIYDIAVNGELTPSGGSLELSVKVKDHQNNVQWVAADTRAFTGAIKFFQYDAGSGKWSAAIFNDLGVPQGDYTIFFAASSTGSSIYLYDSFKVTVAAATLAFETPRAIDDYEYAANPETFAQAGKGIKGDGDYIYLIYHITDQIGNQQVDLLRSENNGDSFLPHVRVNSDDPNSIHLCPALDVTPNGNLHAIWTRGDLSGFGSDLEYAPSTNHGASFVPDIYLGGLYMELWCDIATYGNDKIYTVRNGAPGGSFKLFFDRSHNGGTTWFPDEDLSAKMWGSTPFNDLFVVIDTDSTGNIYVTFISDASPEKQSEWNVYVSKSSDSGNTFSPPKRVNNLDGGIRLPNVVCDSKNGVHVFWVDLDNGIYDDIVHSYSGDGGATFSPMVVVDDVDYDVNEPVVGIDPNTDMLYCAYVSSTIRINKTPDGNNWGESTDVGMSGDLPNIYVDNYSRIHLCWNSGGRIYYTRSMK